MAAMWINDQDESNNPHGPPSPMSPSAYNEWSESGPGVYATGYADSDDGFVGGQMRAEYRMPDPTRSSPMPEEEETEVFSNTEDADYAVNRDLASSNGYESRVQRYLYEIRNLNITIPEAGKNPEGGKYIVYTIRFKDIECRRRYSEFFSLRDTLVNLHPTLIIPPIPEKHSVSDYMIHFGKTKDDPEVIELRKRMFTVFLNRCYRMKDVREDGVWWKFLDPNVSWMETVNSHPISSIPSDILKAPPLDVANPTPAHAFLPDLPASAKLRPSSGSNSEVTSPTNAVARSPPTTSKLTEDELDSYFISFENSSRSLEKLLQGPMEASNQRLLRHYHSLAEELSELGARYNAFSLPENYHYLSQAISQVGQAVDGTFLATNNLYTGLNLSYAEPMRENAQFAGIVRNVLHYRIRKRLQQQVTREELEKQRNLMKSLEQSEMEAQRIEQYLNGLASPPPPRQSGEGTYSDVNSIDSDFPASGDIPGSAATTGSAPPTASSQMTASSIARKLTLGRSVRSSLGKLNIALRGMVDSDPERNRRDQIGKTRESISHLEQALEVAETDVTQASQAVLKDMKRFQKEKEEDLRRYMIAFAKCQIEWAKRSREGWASAKETINQIEVVKPGSEMP